MVTDPHTVCIPALMKPCTAKRSSDYASLVAKGRKLTDVRMTSVLYRDSLGDWPLLAHSQPQESVARPGPQQVFPSSLDPARSMSAKPSRMPRTPLKLACAPYCPAVHPTDFVAQHICRSPVSAFHGHS